MSLRTIFFTLGLLALAFVPAAARAQTTHPAEKPFELLDGDRVVFVGGTFFDRESRLGYIETALTSRFPDRNITFRNLGYAGDTVRCESRTVCEGWANFGPPEEGFQKLKKLVEEIKPTVVFVGYGMSESFEGEQKLPQFVQDYNKLLDMLAEASGAAGGKPRFVLIGPNYHEDLGRPLPDPTEHNKQLKVYSEAIAKIATERGARFVDLFAVTAAHEGGLYEPHLTQDGIQLTPHGYWIIAEKIGHALGFPDWNWSVHLTSTGKVEQADGVKVEGVKVEGDKSDQPKITFTATAAMLPRPLSPMKGYLGVTGVHRLLVTGLPAGQYELKGDGKRIYDTSAETWATKGHFIHGPDADQVEKLRELIVAKNLDYFGYWRHENDTYILGYRKHEQGKNAVELPQFIPLAEAKDKEIKKLKVPQPVTYTLEKAAK